MRWRVLLALVLFQFLAGSCVWAEEQPLDAIRREVHEPEKSSPSTGHHGHSDSDNDCDDEDDSLTAWVAIRVLTAPWWGPHLALEVGDEVGNPGFPVGPYADDHEGYLVLGPQIHTLKEWGGRLSLDAANDFDDVTTLSGRLRLDTAFRMGIDTAWVQLSDRQGLNTDSLGLGDFNFVYRFAQSPQMQFHSGLGVNWLADGDHADFGFNFTYGVDYFPVDPVVASAPLDLGKVGNASLIHFRGTLGTMITPRIHLYSGYDLLNIGGNSIHSLLTGLEFWF